MYNVYVNGKRVDTFNADNIVLNAILLDITDPARRGVTASNKISLPKTANNVAIFNLFDGDFFSKEYTADVYDKTVHILRGDVKIISVGEYITIQIVEKFKQISENLKKPLYELDLSSEDFVYNLTSYNTLKAATTGIWSWELSDNRENANVMDIKTPSSDPYIAAFRPVYNVLELIKQIFLEQGITLDTSAVDEKVSNLRMLSNADDFWVAYYQTTITSGTITAGNKIPLSTSSYDFLWDTAGTSTDFFRVTANTFRAYPSSPQLNVNNIKFVVEIDIDEVATLQVWRDKYTPNSTELVEEHLINKKGTVITQQFDATDTTLQSAVWFSFDKDVTINQIRVIALVSETELYVTDTIYSFVDTSSVVGWERSRTSTGFKYAIVEDLYVKTQYNLPDMTQLGFIQEVIKLFNLTLKTTGSTMALVHNVLGEGVEVDEFVLKRKEIKNNDVYAVKNYFKYSNDVGIYSKDYISKTLSNIFVESKMDGGVDFYNTELSSSFYLGGAKIYSLSSPANTETDDRLQVNEMFFLSTSNDYPALINATKKLTFDGLGFIDLYDEFYSSIYDYLQDSRIVTYSLRIGYKAFLDILESGKIYDSKLGRYLTVLKITKYNPLKETSLIAITREI